MNESSWIDAASEAEVPDDDFIGLQVGEHNIALYKVDGSVFATDNICTHGHARLCDGNVNLRLPDILKCLCAALLDLLTDRLAPFQTAGAVGDLLFQLDKQLFMLLDFAFAGKQAGHAGGA